MASLDVKAGFPKIPLEETINVCCDSFCLAIMPKLITYNKTDLKNF